MSRIGIAPFPSTWYSNALSMNCFNLNGCSLREWALGFSRPAKQTLAIVVDIVSAVVSVWLAFSLRLECLHEPAGLCWAVYMLAPVIAIPIFFNSGLYHSIFRYSGLSSLEVLVKACMIHGALFFGAVMIISSPVVPRSIGLIEPILLILFTGCSRVASRMWLHSFHPRQSQGKKSVENVLIYGAGSAGVEISESLQHSPHYRIIGFLDDDPQMQGKSINNFPIHRPADAAGIVKCEDVGVILLALPAAGRRRREEIYRSLQGVDVHIRTLPGIEAILDRHVTVSDIREYDIDDLLGRDPVKADPSLLSCCIAGKTVMVTGAGGSIGSELCRQIMAATPSRLVLLDHSEYSLYMLNDELQGRLSHHGHVTDVVPVLANVTDEHCMHGICRHFHPETVYHAAAYKHVPMVEENVIEGVRNNIFGTLSVAMGAAENGVEHFVLVSTDKAVRPTSVMGASKRACELVLQAIASDLPTATCFCMVRFGNVLGSSGSVVPLFRRQIQEGGPITLTHEEICRYFMTIPEAAQLVIQAGAMAEGGEVFLLDMGEPVRIIDLARRMVELSGLSVRDSGNPDGDIEIDITGLRPGEKLYEELLVGGGPQPTSHPRIFKANEYRSSWSALQERFSVLRRLIEDQDDVAVRAWLQTVVRGYAPQPGGAGCPGKKPDACCDCFHNTVKTGHAVST